MHVLLTAVNIIRDVRACVCTYERIAHLTVSTHARRARHSMNQNKPVPARAGQGDKEEGQGERGAGKGEREGARGRDREPARTNKPASTRINTLKSNSVRTPTHVRSRAHYRRAILSPLWPHVKL